jgi:hypothetical protein
LLKDAAELGVNYKYKCSQTSNLGNMDLPLTMHPLRSRIMKTVTALTTAENQLESTGPNNAVDAEDLNLKPAATGIGKGGKESALNNNYASTGNKPKGNHLSSHNTFQEIMVVLLTKFSSASNNISVRLAENKYSPLDNAITDIDVSKYFEWIAKCTGGHIRADGTPVDTIEGGAWQLTIYERYEKLRDGYYTEWEETGFNTFPIVTYGFPFSQRTPMSSVAKCIDLLITAFNALTDDDGQNSSVTFAHALVSSFATLLRTSVPANVGMIAYVRIKEWHVAMDGKPYVNNVAEQLEVFDSEFAKYQLAYRDTPLKKEKEETVPTLPIVETNAEPPAIMHAAPTSAATGKRDNESALTDGVNENTKKKAKSTVKRTVTLPQLSNK